MKKNKRKIFQVLGLVTAVVVVIACIAFIWLTSPLVSEEQDVLSNSRYYIAHAMGSIDAQTYLNCEEALFQSLDNGYQYIELDLCMTKDSVLVCVHDWDRFRRITSDSSRVGEGPMTEDEFLQMRIFGKYSPMTLEDAILIRNSHPFTIVTDKISDASILNRYFTTDRHQVMVEAFSLSDYEELKASGYIPMMSLNSFSYSNIFWNFIYYPIKYGGKIDWICIHSSSNMKSLRMLKRLFGTKVAVFTSNSPFFFQQHLGKEIDLVYTDNWNMKEKSNTDSVNITTY